MREKAMRYSRWMLAGMGVVGAAALGLAVRAADAGEAQTPTVTVYKSPT